jgi:RHS repeat-associated protein
MQFFSNTTLENQVCRPKSGINLYPFGSPMPGRNYSSSSYRYGFNGKEKDNEVYGDGNEYDYGMRIYNPRLGRFLSTDPLQKQFAALTPYQFSGNNPIAMVDLDGLEPAPVNPNTQTLVFILQGYGGDPPDNNTQSENAAKTNPGLASDDALGGIFSTGTKLQIVKYASSKTDNTKNDVNATIKAFKAANPNGKIVIVGHSGGGDNAIELAKDNSDVTIDLLITLDTQDPHITGVDDNNIPTNVKNAINYFQTSEAVGGETLDFAKGVNGANILSKGSNHRSIDNDQKQNVMSDINNFIKGKNAVQIAKNRTQVTNNPSKSNSPNVFGDGDKTGATKGTANPESSR